MVSTVLIALGLSAAAPVAADSATAVAGMAFTYSGVLKVDDPEIALKELIAGAEAAGGYFGRKSQDRVELRVPAAKAQAFWQELPKRGLVVEQLLQSENLASYLSDLDARLAAKRNIMDQYLTLLQTAEDSTLLPIMNAVTGLQQEIDGAAGEKTLAGDRVRYARMAVSFSFHDRSAPLPNGTTRFPWINDLSLQNLLDRFGHGQPR